MIAADASNPAVLAFDRRNQEMADWRAMEHRVLPDVKTMSEYRVRSATGLAVATGYLQDLNTANPSIEQIREAHSIAYGTCVKDAGKFRKPGEFAVFGGMNGAESQRIDIEMHKLSAEMDELLADAKTDAQKCAAIAFYHTRFIAIHPFMDGNGRLGRSIMAAQAEKLFPGLSPKGVIDAVAENKPAYIAANGEAIKRDDLAPLTNFLSEGLGVDRSNELEIKSPWKIQCRRMMSLTDIKPLHDEREMSRTGAPLPMSDNHDLDGPSV